jgi:hypothetical protein
VVSAGSDPPAGASSGQWDPQIAVDPVNGRTVYAAWLQNGKSDTVVAKSTDFGATWSVVVADSTNAGTDKPILAVRGQDVYVAYSHAQKIWVSSSHGSGAGRSAYARLAGSWAQSAGTAITPTMNGALAAGLCDILNRADGGGNRRLRRHRNPCWCSASGFLDSKSRSNPEALEHGLLGGAWRHAVADRVDLAGVVAQSLVEVVHRFVAEGENERRRVLDDYRLLG